MRIRLWDLSVESVELVKNLIRKHNIHCDLKQGVMHVSSKLRHAQDIEYEQNYLKTKLNYSAVQLVNKSNLSSMLGTDQYHNGLLYTDAVHLHPLNFALGLANAAKDAGAKLFENSQVVKYRGGKDGLVQTEKGSVKSKCVLLACNGYLDELSSKSAKKIMPINNFILATEPLSDDWCRRINNEDYAVADSQFIVNYFKLSGDNRLLWGGGETYTQSFPKDIASFVKPHMLKVYPELQDINVDYAWGGTLAITMNRMPHFDRLEENVFIAQGYSGHGVAMATLAGKLMADAIQGSAEKFDVFNRYPIPNFPGGTLFRWPGLVLGMMYYSLRDRFL